MNFSKLSKMGYDASQILEVFSQKNAKVARQIARGLAMGYDASQILSVLTGGKFKESEFGGTSTSAQEISRKNEKRFNKNAYLKAGLGAAGLLGGVGLLSRLGGAAGALMDDGDNGSAQTSVDGRSPPSQSPLGLTKENILKQAEGLSKVHQAAQPTQGTEPEDIVSVSPTTEQIAPPTQEPEEVDVDLYKTKTGTGFPQLIQFIEKHRDMGKTPKETLEKLGSSKLLSPLIKRAESETGKGIDYFIDQIYQKGGNKKQSQELADTLHNINQLKKLINSMRKK